MSVEDLFRVADVITVHTPLIAENKTSDQCKEHCDHEGRSADYQLRPRGIIDEKALYDAVKSGKVAGAALDVFEDSHRFPAAHTRPDYCYPPSRSNTAEGTGECRGFRSKAVY